MDDIVLDISYEELMLLILENYGGELNHPNPQSLGVVKVENKFSKFLGEDRIVIYINEV